MATTFKTFTENDIVSSRTLLHEAIPVTGSIVSGTYLETSTATSNIRNYSHGMFQAVYDYPYLSSSSNHLFDLAVAYHTSSHMNGSGSGGTGYYDNDKKVNLYSQMAQVLMGYDATGSIQQFDEDGDITSGGSKLKEIIVMSFSRLLGKDELKKGSFAIELGVSGSNGAPSGSSWSSPFQRRIKITDSHAPTDYRINSPAGEYSILKLNATASTPAFAAAGCPVRNAEESSDCGLLFYQAGIAILTASIFASGTTAAGLNLHPRHGFLSGTNGTGGSQAKGGFMINALPNRSGTIGELMTGSVSGSADAIRHRIYNLSFNNTTELNSTIYFCRANHNEFNYSSNPTYLTGSKIRVKENTLDAPVSYITTVGLYSADNELLAVAKLSEPLKKDPNTELTLRVRLDY